MKTWVMEIFLPRRTRRITKFLLFSRQKNYTIKNRRSVPAAVFSNSFRFLSKNFLPLFHRADHCDLSLFQLDLALFDYLLDFHEHIPLSFVDFKHDYAAFVC